MLFVLEDKGGVYLGGGGVGGCELRAEHRVDFPEVNRKPLMMFNFTCLKIE